MFVDEKKSGETAPVVDEVAELLLKTALAFENGIVNWGQESFYLDGRFCYVGGLLNAASCNDVYDNSFNYTKNTPLIVELAVKRTATIIDPDPDYYDPYTEVFDWNDDEKRTKDEVVAMMRKAAYLK